MLIAKVLEDLVDVILFIQQRQSMKQVTPAWKVSAITTGVAKQEQRPSTS